jgi:ribosomal-protein-alanine N-acetyltransferase
VWCRPVSHSSATGGPAGVRPPPTKAGSLPRDHPTRVRSPAAACRLGSGSFVGFRRPAIKTAGMLSLPEQIAGRRILLRRPRLGDAEAVFVWCSAPLVCRHLTFAPHRSLDETRTYLDGCCRHWAAGSSCTYLITEPNDPALPVGAIDLRDLNSGVLFSFALARASWGRGYALEALKIAIIAAFAHPHVTRMWSFAHPDNAASCRVMEKAGLHFERIVPRFMVFPNLSAEPCDVRLYAITRSTM